MCAKLIPIGSVLDDVGDIDIRPANTGGDQTLVQNLSVLAHEGFTQSYLMLTGITPDQENLALLRVVYLGRNKGIIHCRSEAHSPHAEWARTWAGPVICGAR